MTWNSWFKMRKEADFGDDYGNDDNDDEDHDGKAARAREHQQQQRSRRSTNKKFL